MLFEYLLDGERDDDVAGLLEETADLPFGVPGVVEGDEETLLALGALHGGLEGVNVLNVNELAGAMRPTFLPGEEMQVTVIKEGKEPGQGVGYLNDGTMVVVEKARHMVGRTLNVGVTSVLQTNAGKMLFADVVDVIEDEDKAAGGDKAKEKA